MKEGLWYRHLPEGKVYCSLCPHECIFAPGGKGKCRVRQNIDGTLIAANYGKAGGYALDPIEKKPLYHFHPGTQVLSVGAKGCNFRCEFCQNWQLAQGQGDRQEVEVTPFGLISAVERYRSYYEVIGLAYTYSEPMMWYEFVLDASRLAKENGMKNVIVTNGFINEKPLKQVLPYLDAFNIDIKAFSEEFYQKVVHGSLAPVLKTAERAKNYGCHVEITTLLIPNLNDSSEEISKLAKWVGTTLGKDTPMHFSRYFPNHRMKLDPTPVEVLERAREIAMEEVNYVYLGNLGPGEHVDSFCPSCGSKVLERSSGTATIKGILQGKCRECGEILNFPGV